MFQDEENYFKSALDFFEDYQWLFRYPVTELLVRNLFDFLPNVWQSWLEQLDYPQLNDFVIGKLIDNDKPPPPTLMEFFKVCQKLNRLPKSLQSSTCKLPEGFTKGLSYKKQQEIFYFTQIIHEKCSQDGIQTIVDLGAGLGYICQMLHHLHGYQVLGLESNAKNVKIARERQQSMYPESQNNVKYICAEIGEESLAQLEENIEKYFPSNLPTDKICIIGLHSCGDLSVNSFKLFSAMKSAKLLIMLSCCYHKLAMNEKNHFINFPLSSTLKKIVNSNDKIKETLDRPFLRLACQEPAARWENMSAETHEQHAFCVLARAVLELFAQKHDFTLKKCVQKGTRKSQCQNFDSYLMDSLKRYTFNDKNCSKDEKMIWEVKKLWKDHENKLTIAEFYSGLQLMLQSPAESLVLCDRRCWLLEQGYKAEIITILDSKISPRCHAIAARK